MSSDIHSLDIIITSMKQMHNHVFVMITRLVQVAVSKTCERQKLNDVVERCVEKLEKESRERPHLVDKRMVTQMLAYTIVTQARTT